jgi:hypothetical protein
MTNTPAAGWYPDPDVPGGQRYFDSGWTDHRVAPPASPGPLPLTPERIADQRRTRRLLLIVLAPLAALFVAAALIYWAWPPSAADRRHENATKVCAQLVGQAGITRDHLTSDVLAAYDDCVARMEQAP